MTVQTGIGKKVVYKKELVAWGTKAVAAGGRYLRRVTSDLDLSKDTYASNEIVSTYQVSDFRHGARKVAGGIKGELSPGSYWELMQSAVRGTGAANADKTGLSIAMGAVALVNGIPTHTLTRTVSTWFADSFRVGQVIKITAGLVNAANANKHLLILSFTSTLIMVVTPLNGVACASEGPTASTVNTPGKYVITPATGQTNESYSIEHVYADITQSEVFTGCRVASMAINLPPSGMSTCEIGFMGKDVEVGTTAYFSSLVGPSTKGVVAAVNGIVSVAGSPIGILTGLSINLAGGMTVGQVVGSNFTPDVFAGRVNVSGQFTAYFDGVTQRDAFLNETEISIVAGFSTGSLAASDFISFCMPRVKIGGAQKSDGEQGLILTCPFQALYNPTSVNTTGLEATTLQIQDSNDTMA